MKTTALQAAQQKIPVVQAEGDTLRNQVNSTSAVIQDLQGRLAAAPEADKPAIQQQIDTQKQILNQLQQSLNAKISEAAALQNQITQAQNEISTANSQLVTLRAEAQQIQTKLAELQNNLEEANRRSREIGRAKEQAQAELQNRAREVEFAQRNFDKVRENIDYAARVLRAEGEDHGSSDGLREGTELGTQRGQRDGDARGSADGRNAGTKAGQSRDYEAGYASGRNQATQDAISKSNIDAQAAGEKDGLQNGRVEGLKEAYNIGMRQGLEHGAKTGDDREAYNEGRKQGEADGLAQAIADAQPQVEIGYKDKENEFLNAPLKSVVVGDQAQGQKFKGLQGRFSNEGDDRYYRPQPGILPHPHLERYYLEAYDSAYRSSLSQSYSNSYQSTYNSAYKSSYRQSYDQAFAQSYPDSQKLGYNKGYGDTYQSEYDKNYKIRYAAVYQQTYQRTFDQYKLDKTEQGRGFKDGNRIASKQKGYNEGNKAAYAANIEVEKKKAYAVGVAKANDLYTNNPVIKVSALELREEDGDNIFRPSKNMYIIMKIKNFGLKAKTDLQSELSEVQGAIVVAAPKVTTASIPAQSDATVIVPIQSSVVTTAADGTNIQFVAKAVTGAKVFANQKFSVTAQYPAKVQISGFDGILIPGVPTDVKVLVENRSKSIQNLNISIGVDTAKVQIAQDKFNLSNIAPGQRQEFQLKLTGKLDARFEETGLNLSTVQNSLQFAMESALKMTIIQRHAPTADSKGLILSANLAAGAGKKLYSIDKFDTWDLRVDGAVQDITKLDGYKGKTIHVLADAYSKIDDKSLATLNQYVAKNGSVIVWGSRFDYSPLGQELLKTLGAKFVGSQTLNGAVAGAEKLKGLSMNARGIVSVLASNSRKASNVLSSSVGNIAVMSFSQGTADTVGQSLAVGFDINDLEPQQVQQLLKTYAASRVSFTNKLAQGMASPGSVMHLIVQEIGDEMAEAEVTHQGGFYKNNEKNNKIYRAASKFIGEAGRKSAQALELSKYYPTLVSMIGSKLNKEAWRAQAVLDKRHGSALTARSIKDIYCSNNGNSKLCDDPGRDR